MLLNVEYKTIKTIIPAINANNPLDSEPFFQTNPVPIIITTKTINPIAKLENISAKNKFTELNCKDIKPTERAIMMLTILLSSKISVLNNIPRIIEKINKKGNTCEKTPICSIHANKLPAVEPYPYETKLITPPIINKPNQIYFINISSYSFLTPAPLTTA